MLPKEANNQEEVKEKQQDDKFLEDLIEKTVSNMLLSERMSSLSPSLTEYKSYWKDIHKIDFDCFKFDEACKGNSLALLMNFLFHTQNLFMEMNIPENILINYITKIQTSYGNNPYHNKLHAFDVVHFLLQTCKFASIASLSHIDISAMYLAAAVHDFEHPGVNNVYLIASRNPLAIRYNDRSVLENHHISSSWALALSSPDLDIFKKMDNDTYKVLREHMIDMVLKTDMGLHFTNLARLKERISNSDFEPKKKDKLICMGSILHVADINIPIKPFNIYFRWAEKCSEEFFKQGDLEREAGLPISYLMDKYSVNLAKSQIGFIDVICKPIFEVLARFLPELDKYLNNCDSNKKEWGKLIENYDQLLNEVKNNSS